MTIESESTNTTLTPGTASASSWNVGTSAPSIEHRFLSSASDTPDMLTTVDGLFSANMNVAQSFIRKKKKKKKKNTESDQASMWPEFKSIMVRLSGTALKLHEVVASGVDPMDDSHAILEIEDTLYRLGKMHVDPADYLPETIVAIESSLLGEKWDHRHVAFLVNSIAFLKSRSHVDQSAIDTIYDFKRQAGLDQFRGSLH